MFKVLFRNYSAFSVSIFDAERIEPCIELALALHRSSNVPHIVTVVHHALDKSESDSKCLLSLSLDPPATSKESKNE